MPKRKIKQPLELEPDIEKFSEDDITTSEDELSDSEKKLLEKVRQKRVPENYDSEEEVFALHGDEDDDDDDDDDDDQIHDSMESDLDQPKDDDDLPNDRAWGSKKKTYYNTDYVDPDYATTNPKDLEAAEAEEREAILIQERLAREMDDADYGFHILSKKTEQDEDESCEVIKVDYSSMSQTQRVELFHRENPEFSSIFETYMSRLEELKDTLLPILSLIEEKKVSPSGATKFLQTKYQLLLDYCTNASFYLMLKAKKIPVGPHPVLQRLAQFDQLIKQLEEKGKDLMEDVAVILEGYKKGQPVYNTEGYQKESKNANEEIESKKKKKKKKKQVVDETNDVSEKMSKKMKQVMICEPEEADDESEDEDEEYLFYHEEDEPDLDLEDQLDSDSEDNLQKDSKDSKKEKLSKERQIVDEKNSKDEKKSKKMKKLTICEPEKVDNDELEEDNDEEMDEDDEINSRKGKRAFVIEDLPIEQKRAITYEIAKNKGLTPYRKKEQRNPRVKHRIKYQKAKVRRKGAVREVRKELERYSGEISGIKASVKKSIKLK